MEEFTEEFAALEARRDALIDKMSKATDPAEIERMRDELRQIDAQMVALGEEDA